MFVHLQSVVRFALFALVFMSVAIAPNAHASALPEAHLAERSVLAFPPQNRGGKQAVFVYLHGIGGAPDRGCREFERSVASYGWLVCPRGNVKNDAQSYSWGGTVEDRWRTVEQAIESVASEPEVDPNAKIVLLGFSQGGYVAAEFIRAYPKRIRAALFVGANVRFNKTELEKAGVTKVGYAAGEYDATYSYLRQSHRTLERESYASQFRGLGKVGHTYIGENEAATLDSLVSWLGGSGD
jgi:predicted esterase